MKLSVILPTHKRPKMVRRMLANIFRQTFKQAEIFFIGDCCPDYETLLTSGELDSPLVDWYCNGGRFHMMNQSPHRGISDMAVNFAIKNASGEYFMFVADDDSISSTHFENYLKHIDGTEYDMVAIPSLCDLPNPPMIDIRIPRWEHAGVGDSEVIIRTSVLKKVPPRDNQYSHDWRMIDWILNNGYKAKIFEDAQPTYIVRGMPNNKRPSE
jgi:glycosyltransferase involved in cell wall biosynthesis